MEILFYKEKTKKLFQWDQKVPMEVTGIEDAEAIEAVFSAVGMNRGERRTLEFAEDKWSCDVPDIVLQYGTMISVFITATANGRQTTYTEKIEVVRQTRPDGYVDNDDPEYIKTDELIKLAKDEADRAETARSGAEAAVVKAFDELREIVREAEAEKNSAKKIVDDGAIAVNQIAKKAEDAEENAKTYSETAKSFSDQAATSVRSASQSAYSASLASKSSADSSELARRYSAASETYASRAASNSGAAEQSKTQSATYAGNAKESEINSARYEAEAKSAMQASTEAKTDAEKARDEAERFLEEMKKVGGFGIYWCSASEVTAEGFPKVTNPNDTTLYLVPSKNQTANNIFDEYVWKNAWEKIGAGVSVDLSQYAKTADVDRVYAKKTEVPKKISELTSDSTHRTVTDAEKQIWNGKSNFSGNYNDLSNKPNLFSGDYEDLSNKPTIPEEYDDTEIKKNLKDVTDDIHGLSEEVEKKYTKPDGGIPTADLSNDVDAHINSLIDDKLTPLEKLSERLLEVL